MSKTLRIMEPEEVISKKYLIVNRSNILVQM